MSFSYVTGKPVVYTIRTSVDTPGLTGLVPVSRQNNSDNRIGARVAGQTLGCTQIYFIRCDFGGEGTSRVAKGV